jgi:hypothetical protein
MKTNIINYLLLSALITLGTQDVMASAAENVEQEVNKGLPGRPGQTIRVSMVYHGEDPQPNPGSLTGFAVTLPGGVVENVEYKDGEERLSINDHFDVNGLISFPVRLTYESGYFIDNGNETESWRGFSNVQCKANNSIDISRLEAVRILWDAHGQCSLKYKYLLPPAVKSAAKR